MSAPEEIGLVASENILLERQLAEARAERDEARGIVRDIHWMAVRYADGRRSYAPGMLNDALRKAYDGGWLTYRPHLQHDPDPQYAREGDKQEYRSIEARIAALEAQNGALIAAISWIEPPFADENTSVDELRRRVALCVTDAKRALAAGKEGA